MIEDPVYEELRKYGKLLTADDVYTADKVEEMKKDLEKGNLYVVKESKLVLKI
jgi:hypothetical protein